MRIEGAQPAGTVSFDHPAARAGVDAIMTQRRSVLNILAGVPALYLLSNDSGIIDV